MKLPPRSACRSSRRGASGLLALVLWVFATLPQGASAEHRRRSDTGEGSRASSARPKRVAKKKKGKGKLTAAYRKQKRRWHERADRTMTSRWQAQGLPPLVLRPVGTAESFVLRPRDAQGNFDDSERQRAEAAFACRRSGETHGIHPRLLSLLYKAMRHFEVPYIHVISGYRAANASDGSRHRAGLAADVVFPGVSDKKLSTYFRAQGFVGVGIYPNSGFVHVDVRQSSHFWTDRSLPGRPSRTRGEAKALAHKMDQLARRRGEQPPELDIELAAAEESAH